MDARQRGVRARGGRRARREPGPGTAFDGSRRTPALVGRRPVRADRAAIGRGPAVVTAGQAGLIEVPDPDGGSERMASGSTGSSSQARHLLLSLPPTHAASGVEALGRVEERTDGEECSARRTERTPVRTSRLGGSWSLTPQQPSARAADVAPRRNLLWLPHPTPSHQEGGEEKGGESRSAPVPTHPRSAREPAVTKTGPAHPRSGLQIMTSTCLRARRPARAR